MKKTNKLLAMILVVVMIASIIPMASANNVMTFSDVNSTDWFYADVMAMAKEGAINGYTDGTFKPNDPVTHAEFATMMAKAMAGTALKDEWENETITDAMTKSGVMTTGEAQKWWTPYVLTIGQTHGWEKTEAMDGMTYDGKATKETWAKLASNAELPMSRKDVIMSIGHYAPADRATDSYIQGWTDYDLEYYEDVNCSNYTGWDEIKCTESLVLMATGVLRGSTSGNLNLDSNVTRAEMAALLNRMTSHPEYTTDYYTPIAKPVQTETTSPVEKTETQPATTTTTEVSIPETTTTTTTTKGQYDMTKYTVPADFNQDGILTEAEVEQMLDQLQEKYPTGSSLADALGDKGYTFPGDPGLYYYSPVMNKPNVHGGDCIAWAYFVSDSIFGNLPYQTIDRNEWEFDDLRPGDVFYDDGSHVNVLTETYIGEYFPSIRTTDSGSAHEIDWNDRGGDTNVVVCQGKWDVLTRYPQ